MTLFCIMELEEIKDLVNKCENFIKVHLKERLKSKKIE